MKRARAQQRKPSKKKPCDVACYKCGSMDVSRRFRMKGVRWDASHSNVRESCYVSVELHGFVRSKKDHISHHCRCCQYAWEADCLT